MKIEFSKHAERRLDGVYDFLARKSQSAAVKYYNAILDEIERLITFPESASIEPILAGRQEKFRSLVVQPHYKVVYFFENETINVVDVWDTRQNPSRLKRGFLKSRKK